MIRTSLVLILLTAVFAGPGISTLVAQEQESGLTPRERDIESKLTETFQKYEAQLQAVLKTRFAQEKDFVAEVVLFVQEEKIPKNLVDSAWLWVRQNRPFTNHPFVYFERVLRLLGQRADVPIPPFDPSIYNNRTAQRIQSQLIRGRR